MHAASSTITMQQINDNELMHHSELMLLHCYAMYCLRCTIEQTAQNNV